MTPPFRLNTARRPNAGVAEEPCPYGAGCIRSYKNEYNLYNEKNTFQKINLEKTEG